MLTGPGRRGVRWWLLRVLVSLPVVASCTAVDDSDVGSEPPLSGILLGADDLAPRSVSGGAVPELPGSAPAYRVSIPTSKDLERLAEAYAGRPVVPEAFPLAPSDEPSFTTGDGWFAITPNGENDGVTTGRLTWSWLQEAWFETGQRGGPASECPPAADVEAVVLEFFSGLGMEVIPDGIRSCAAAATRVGLDVLLDGLPVVGVQVEAVVDVKGDVVFAYAPLLVVQPLAEVALAPANEIQRRFVRGPGFLSSYYPCSRCTWSPVEDRPLGLALTVNGGVGPHDHTPGGMVPGAPEVFLVPALNVTATYTWRGSSQLVSRGILAVSSAELVADPAEAEAARTADGSASVADASCVGANDMDVGLCVSRLSTPAGTAVLFTVDGEVYVPVGAEDCAPVLRLDPGDGTPARTFTPVSGTLVTARVAHTYTDPGTYAVTALSASRCTRPGSGGAGEESEYEFSQTAIVTVTE